MGVCGVWVGGCGVNRHGGRHCALIGSCPQRTMTVECLAAECSTTFVCPTKTLQVHDGKVGCGGRQATIN